MDFNRKLITCLKVFVLFCLQKMYLRQKFAATANNLPGVYRRRSVIS